MKLNGLIKMGKTENIYENGKFYKKYDLEQIQDDGTKMAFRF